MMRRIFFFATPEDVVPVLTRFEAGEPLKYVALGDFTTPNRSIYLQASDIPDPGIATHETGSASMGYMVSLRDTTNHMQRFIGKKGEHRWSLNNGDNEETVMLTMAGLWEDGTLLPGLMDTLHQTPVAQRLMRKFIAALKQESFVRLDIWWVGKSAMSMLQAGRRLATSAVQSPPQFDLKLSE